MAQSPLNTRYRVKYALDRNGRHFSKQVCISRPYRIQWDLCGRPKQIYTHTHTHSSAKCMLEQIATQGPQNYMRGRGCSPTFSVNTYRSMGVYENSQPLAALYWPQQYTCVTHVNSHLIMSQIKA